MGNGFRDNACYVRSADAKAKVSLPAYTDTSGFVEIDCTDDNAVYVRVYCVEDYQYVFAADETAAAVLFAAETFMVMPASVSDLIPCRQTTEKLYIRGDSNGSDTADALNYEILRG